MKKDKWVEAVLSALPPNPDPARPFVVAIDGRCAAGKTTLAKHLEARLGENCAVFHMDDFFLPFCLRTKERLSLPGGNVHHERFKIEVLNRLGGAFTYHAFDCATGRMTPVAARPAPIALIEGSYALHPALRAQCDLRVFLDISPALQWARLVRREPPDKLPAFRSRWIPLEEAYFDACAVRQACDILLTAEKSDCDEA